MLVLISLLIIEIVATWAELFSIDPRSEWVYRKIKGYPLEVFQ